MNEHYNQKKRFHFKDDTTTVVIGVSYDQIIYKHGST